MRFTFNSIRKVKFLVLIFSLLFISRSKSGSLTFDNNVSLHSEPDPYLEDVLTKDFFAPGISLIKTGIPLAGGPEAGPGCDVIFYQFTITNEGSEILENIVLNDPLLGGVIPGPVIGDSNNDGFLDLDEVWIYSGTYNPSQSDVENGFIENQATVTANVQGQPEQTLQDLSDDDSVLEDDPTKIGLSFCLGADIGLIKQGNAVDIDGDGCVESILYTFTLTNTGTVGIDEIILEDELLGGEVPGPVEGTDTDNDGILSVGETWTYEAIYAITQEDIDNTAVVNQAEVNGEIVNRNTVVFDLSHDTNLDQDGPTRTPVPDDACTERSAGMGLIKVGEVIDINNDGCDDTVRYTFTLTNTGSVDIGEITLEDELLGGEIPGPQTENISEDSILESGEVWTYTAYYPITQEDIDSRSIINQASVAGKPTVLEVIISDNSDDDSNFEDNPTVTRIPADACLGEGGIGIIKTGTLIDTDGNLCEDSIGFIFTVTNTGSFNLDNVIIEDELVDNNIQGPLDGSDFGDDGVLSVGESWTFEAIYFIQKGDIDEGLVENQAVVTAQLVGPAVQISDLSDHTNLSDNNPTITIVPDNICTDGSTEFEIFNGITPNGDGVNDYFRIQGIENYPDNNLKIFNRWGVQVYQMDSYGQGNNLFYGISEARATLQKDRELPSGTYFYILTFTSDNNPGEENYSGYLYINRN